MLPRVTASGLISGLFHSLSPRSMAPRDKFAVFAGVPAKRAGIRVEHFGQPFYF